METNESGTDVGEGEAYQRREVVDGGAPVDLRQDEPIHPAERQLRDVAAHRLRYSARFDGRCVVFVLAVCHAAALDCRAPASQARSLRTLSCSAG